MTKNPNTSHYIHVLGCPLFSHQMLNTHHSSCLLLLSLHHSCWPCVSPGASLTHLTLQRSHGVNPHSLALIYSGPHGNQPCLFQRFHPHRAEGGKRGHHRWWLHWPVPGKERQVWTGKGCWIHEASGTNCKRWAHLNATVHIGVHSTSPSCLLIWKLKVLLTDAPQLWKYQLFWFGRAEYRI